MGSGGKSSNMMGSSGKSGMGTTGKSNVFMSSSPKKETPVITSSKSMNVFASNAKPSNMDTAKAGSMYGTTGKNANLFGSSGKNSSPYGGDKITKATGSSEKSSNSLLTSAKKTNMLGSDDKNNKPKNFSGTSVSPSRDYPSFINPKDNKSKTTFGIIWIPTRKNKKKDLVFNSHKYERYKEKSPSMYSYMSGDSPAYQPQKKKEEETDLLVPERPKVTTVAVNTGITAASIDIASDGSGPVQPEEKQEFIKHNPEETKEAAGDTNDRSSKEDCEYLENNENMAKPPDNKWDKDKQVDRVDSVYLRAPPPHKVHSTATTNEEEDCGIKCLYYTLQCCDCVLQ
ncbi:uncharacterized protein LOC114361192 [Ostrinia furnacalis]|uniref:uncharacterized protein LOC114361192 n=1 Tax=Ostrinia furnacalis TaxID=93504 RepID=UPI00103E1DBF|nr:uncharacterized protein LOC114361192 [Ostrinia furnacalis]